MGYIHPFRHNQVFLWGPKPRTRDKRKINSLSGLLIGKVNLLGSRYKTIMLIAYCTVLHVSREFAAFSIENTH